MINSYSDFYREKEELVSSFEVDVAHLTHFVHLSTTSLKVEEEKNVRARC